MKLAKFNSFQSNLCMFYTFNEINLIWHSKNYCQFVPIKVQILQSVYGMQNRTINLELST